MFWSLVLSFRVRLDWSYAQAQETEVLVQMLSRFPSSIDPNKIPGYQEVRGVTVSRAGQRGPPPIPCMSCLSHRCSVSLLNKGRVGGSRWGWVLQIKIPCHALSLSLSTTTSCPDDVA